MGMWQRSPFRSNETVFNGCRVFRGSGDLVIANVERRRTQLLDERRERVSHHDWSGDGGMNSRRRVTSTVMRSMMYGIEYENEASPLSKVVSVL